MKDILENINYPKDVKKLNYTQLNHLAAEIRQFLIKSVSQTGGHLASNLGVVELTLALMRVFNFPEDKIVWDVGHQSYVYKMLTGRRAQFDTLRKFDGLSGFPKRCESEYDCFDTGHSSTSISAAVGIARARDLDGKSNDVIAVFGDGALTGGMMYEALNDVGRSKTKLILILNDNEMSIAENVGAMSKYLRRLRSQPRYYRSKEAVEGALKKLPVGGEALTDALKLAKKQIRRAVIPTTFFEDFGMEYVGPVDGHDIGALVSAMHRAKQSEKSTVIHIHTKKGKGYTFAENNPQKFHGISQFDTKSGVPLKSAEDYSAVFGKKLLEMAKDNRKIIAITGAMPSGTGLSEFSKVYKDRFFDVGIAEQHAVTFAAGLASAGYVPVVPLYSSFLQRAYDQVLHDVCLQNLHVVFGVDRAGIVGSDGATHQGMYDIAFLSHMPNMTVLSPTSFDMLREMMDYAINRHSGPIAIRYPRGAVEAADLPQPFEIGRAAVSGDGSDAVIITAGRMVKTAQDTAKILEGEGIGTKIVSLRTIKPIDTAAIINAASGAKCVVTLEDAVIGGGIGSIVAAELMKNGISVKFNSFAFPDEPIKHGSISKLDRFYGMDSQSVAEKIKDMIK